MTTPPKHSLALTLRGDPGDLAEWTCGEPGPARATATCCRGPRWTSRSPSTWSGRSARTSGCAAPRRSASGPSGWTGSTRRRRGCRPRRWPPRSRRWTPPYAPPWRRPPAGPAPCTRRSAARTRTSRSPTGGTVTERWVPVRRVGLYVPGGLVAYPSSVVMDVVPAQVAGVGSLAVASPPQRDNDGLPHPVVLAACALLGVDEVHAVGGAQAVAMFAYGTDDCEPTDLVMGPGNVYVASAKRLLRGVVGIDSEAGPDRDRHPGRRHRRRPVRRRRPGRAGRARRQRVLPAGDAGRGPAGQGRRRARPAGAGHPAPRAGRDGAARPSRRTSWSTTSSRAWPSSTSGPPSTSRS